MHFGPRGCLLGVQLWCHYLNWKTVSSCLSISHLLVGISSDTLHSSWPVCVSSAICKGILSKLHTRRLAASATPKSSACIAAIRNTGIKHVYTLTEEEPLPNSFFSLDGPKHTFSPLADGRAPSFAQVMLLKSCLSSQGMAGTLWWDVCHVYVHWFCTCHKKSCDLKDLQLFGDWA